MQPLSINFQIQYTRTVDVNPTHQSHGVDTICILPQNQYSTKHYWNQKETNCTFELPSSALWKFLFAVSSRSSFPCWLWLPFLLLPMQFLGRTSPYLTIKAISSRIPPPTRTQLFRNLIYQTCTGAAPKAPREVVFYIKRVQRVVVKTTDKDNVYWEVIEIRMPMM